MRFWPFRSTLDLPKLAVDTTVDASAIVRGDVKSSRGVQVEGTVHGRVESEGGVIVGEKGVVAGGVSGAKGVVVLGRVRGDVTTDGELHVGPAGSVLGDVKARAIHVLPGGALLGRSSVGDETRANAVLPAVSVPPAALPGAAPRLALPEPLSGPALVAATSAEPSQDVDPAARAAADADAEDRATMVAPSSPPPVPKGRTLPPPRDAAVPPPASGSTPSTPGVVQSGVMPTVDAPRADLDSAPAAETPRVARHG